MIVLDIWRYLKGSTLFFPWHLFMWWCYRVWIDRYSVVSSDVIAFFCLTDLRLNFASKEFHVEYICFCSCFRFFFNILLALLYLSGLFFWQLRSLCRLMMFPVFHVNNEWHIDLKLSRWNACLWLRLMLFLDVFFQIAGLIWIISFSWYLKCLTGYTLFDLLAYSTMLRLWLFIVKI